MILTADYHTHTKYSDGKNTVLENAARAKELGLKAIAVTEHGFTHIVRGLRRREKRAYVRDIRAAEAQTGIPVLVGVEANILGREGTSDLTEEDFLDFDVYLAGFHACSRHESFHDFVAGISGLLREKLHKRYPAWLIRETTQAYCNAVRRNPLDVITHINYECCADAVEVAKCCRDYGTYVEISGKKPHFTDEELFAVAETGVRFVVNSDAHSVDRIGDVELAVRQIERVGIPLDRIDNIDGRTPCFRLAAYKRERL